MRKIFFFIITALLLVQPQYTRLFAATEKEMFNEIQRLSEKRDSAGLQKTSNTFFKQFPQSRLVPDIRFILAENEKNPADAVKKYKTLINVYPNYAKRDEAQLRICEIYSLQGDWKALGRESLSALKLFPNSGLVSNFQLFYCEAAVNLYQYEQSQTVSNDIIKHEKNYDKLANAALLSANTYRYKTGYSRDYIYALRELLLKYENHHIHAAALLLLADFYEKTNDAGKAVAAYNDLGKKFPHAPETAMMRERHGALLKKNIKPEAYMPDQKTIDKSQSIDLTYRGESPGETLGGIYYAVSVGPFPNIKAAAEIQPTIKKFGAFITIRKNEGFYYYVGRHKTTQSAFETKIRMAEEYGINGSIVRFAGDETQRYIYKEEQ